MPKLARTTIHETHIVYPDRPVESRSKMVYEIDVTDLCVSEAFHVLGCSRAASTTVTHLRVSLSDHGAPFITAHGPHDHQQRPYHGQLPAWAADAVAATIPNALNEPRPEQC